VHKCANSEVGRTIICCSLISMKGCRGNGKVIGEKISGTLEKGALLLDQSQEGPLRPVVSPYIYSFARTSLKR
jgi:hypothetical protein